MYEPLKRGHDYGAKHWHDVYTNLGYVYRGNLFKNTLSKQLFANEKTGKILREIEKMIFLLIEETKTLKTRFVFAVDKDSKLIN